MSRTTKFVPLAVVAATAVVTAACGSSGGKPAAASGTSAPMTAAAPGAPTGSGAVVATASSGLGQFLVDGAGRTLYLFEADKGTSSTCYDACSQAWPPLLTTGWPTAGTGANAAELGTTTRKNGTVEVTYHGHPLYHYVADTAVGDMNGQSLNQFGAKWYVLAPSGAKIDND